MPYGFNDDKSKHGLQLEQATFDFVSNTTPGTTTVSIPANSSKKVTFVKPFDGSTVFGFLSMELACNDGGGFNYSVFCLAGFQFTQNVQDETITFEMVVFNPTSAAKTLNLLQSNVVVTYL